MFQQTANSLDQSILNPLRSYDNNNKKNNNNDNNKSSHLLDQFHKYSFQPSGSAPLRQNMQNDNSDQQNKDEAMNTNTTSESINVPSSSSASSNPQLLPLTQPIETTYHSQYKFGPMSMIPSVHKNFPFGEFHPLSAEARERDLALSRLKYSAGTDQPIQPPQNNFQLPMIPSLPTTPRSLKYNTNELNVDHLFDPQQQQQQQQRKQHGTAPKSGHRQTFMSLPPFYYPTTSRPNIADSLGIPRGSQEKKALDMPESVEQTDENDDVSEDAIAAAIKAAEKAAAKSVGLKQRKSRTTYILTEREAQESQLETFECESCHKIFSRYYNLKSHMKTHSDAKPFSCSICGRKFARNHDRKRHELLHEGAKRFECGGVLNDGTTKWGCGKRFSRADGLGRHFRTESGWLCIRPLMNEVKEMEAAAETDSKDNVQNLSKQTEKDFQASSFDEIVNRLIGKTTR